MTGFTENGKINAIGQGDSIISYTAIEDVAVSGLFIQLRLRFPRERDQSVDRSIHYTLASPRKPRSGQG
jgi:hypothetical protein